MLLQPVEARLPLPLLLGDPADQILHAVGIQPAWSALAFDSLVNEPAAPENADVAGDRLVREVERLGEFSHSRIATSEPGKDRSASPIAQGSEGGIQAGIGVRRLDHTMSLSTTHPLRNDIVE